MTKRFRPPMQPVIRNKRGKIAFQENRMVTYLLDAATQKGIDMNHLCLVALEAKWPKSDMVQFLQLIGYTVDGLGGVSYVRPEDLERADAKAAALTHEEEKATPLR